MYAIYLEPDVPDEAREALRDVLQSDDRIDGWWNHLPGLYLVTFGSTASVLSKMVEGAVKPWSFLVIKVDPAESQGWLPDRAWSWIQRRYA